MNYNTEELFQNLKEIFRACDFSESNGFTFSVQVSGASGGNCWGDSATPFRKDSDEIISEMQDEIVSGVRDFLSLINVNLNNETLNEKAYSLAQGLVDSSYDSTSDSDYYGNYSDYNKYFVSFNEILEFVDNLISNEDKTKIINIANNAQAEVVVEKTREIRFKSLQDIERKIASFTTDCSNEEKLIKAQLDKAKKDVETITKKLSTLEKSQKKKLESLEKTKKDLIGFLGEDYIKSKTTKKKKHGY